jgi:hypothetical protein
MEKAARNQDAQRRAGGIAALYLALAYVAAMAYFILAVDYQGAIDPASKVALVVGHRGSMRLVNLVSYVAFGLGLIVVALSLHDRMRDEAPLPARLVAGLGIAWACLLVASGAVGNMGMEAAAGIYAVDPAGAASAWRIFEAVADGLGGGGGEALGGPWMLAAGWAVLSTKRLPGALGWSALAIGAAGVASNAPPLRDAAYAFGLLQIVWFAWLGAALLGKPRKPLVQ